MPTRLASLSAVFATRRRSFAMDLARAILDAFLFDVDEPAPGASLHRWISYYHSAPLFHSAMTTTSNNRQWCLYLIECRDGSFYAGITNDLDARYRAHVEGRGARYTRAHPPIRLIGAKAYENRSAASRAEWEIKQLPKQKKIAYLQL